jgi:hypothetical protein
MTYSHTASPSNLNGTGLPSTSYATNRYVLWAEYEPISGDAPTCTVDPSISGTIYSGDTLTVDQGTWTGSPSFTQRWVRVNPVGVETDIAGETGTTYDLVDGDIGYRIKVYVTGSNAFGSFIAHTGSTEIVLLDDPVAVTAPFITGQIAVGQTLTGFKGLWTGKPVITYEYKWQLGDENASNWADISDETTNTYTIVEGDAGGTLRFGVKATNGNAVASEWVYTPSTVVVPTEDQAPYIIEGHNPTVPFRPEVGVEQNAYPGLWGGYPEPTLTYQWMRSTTTTDWVNINGATSVSYTPVEADRLYRLVIMVTATNDAGYMALMSEPSYPIPREATDEPYTLTQLRTDLARVNPNTDPILYDLFSDVVDIEAQIHEDHPEIY